MSFWDWILDPSDMMGDRNSNTIKGTPRAASRRLGRGGNQRDYGNEITSGAQRIADAYSGRGSRTRFTGGKFGKFNDSSFGGRRSREGSEGDVSISDILETLQALQDPSRYMGDGDFTDEAMAAASAQYDPIIAALRSQASGASDRANRNYGQLGNMFSSLSNDLQGDIPEIQQMYSADKATLANSYKQLENNIQSQYASTQADQEAMMQRLNIEAAASEVLPKQQQDADFFSNMAAAEGQTMQSALGQEERGAVEYTRQGSQIARAEGTNRQADLMSDLQDLLNQYDSQIGAQQSAKQNAYTALLGQMQSDSQNSALDRAQRDFENYIAMTQLGRDLRKDEIGSGVVKSVRSPADVAGRAMGFGLDEQSAQSIQDVFMSALGNDQQIIAGIDPLFGGKLSKEALANRIVEAGRKNGLSREELNALQTIALEYFRG